MANIINDSGGHSLQKDTDATYAVIASCVGVPREQLTADMSFVEDLGTDSIDLLAIVLELEEEFGVVVSDEALFRIRTVGDAVPCIALARELRTSRGLEAAAR